MRKLFAVANLLGLAIGLALSTTAHATPVIGSAQLGSIGGALAFGEIDWINPFNPGPDVAATYGAFSTNGASNTGSFAGPNFSGLSFGALHDISGNPVDANYGYASVFLRFAAQPGWTFYASYLGPGTYPWIPVSFVQDGANVNATILVGGLVCDTGGDTVCDVGDDVSNWTGSFTGTYRNTSIAAINAILIGGGTVSTDFSGSINATAIPGDGDGQVPEPASLTLIGLALAGVGAAHRRKARSALA